MTAASTFMQAGKFSCGPQSANSTEAYRVFIANVHEFWHFIGRIFQLADRMDKTLDTLAVATDTDRESLFNYRELIARDKPLIGELLITRSADAFLTYIAHLLSLLFHEKPEIVQDVVNLKLADVLRHTDRDSIIQYAVDRYVQDLSYKGLRDLYRDIKDKCGFRLFSNEDALSLAIEAVGIRNVIVHNNGVVDYRLARDVGRFRGQIGEKAKGYNPIELPSRLILSAVDIDRRAQEKWALPAGTTVVPHRCHEMENAEQADSRRARATRPDDHAEG
jgi:hypothetical protein